MKKLPIYLLIILGVVTRFVPHPGNFTAMGAIALFSGLYLSKKESLILPLAAMFISDIFIGFYRPSIMASVYIGFILMVLIGQYLKNKIGFWNVTAGVLSGSLIFFLLTNAAVWLFGTMYTHNFSGLLQSYYMALPFWRNEIIGDLFYTGVLIGGYEMIKKMVPQTNAQVIK
ncbi:MAG: hypothetical protein HY979_03475 [Candidatus Magasanikbacteria bacterium]|nr:hypothetical protein [Candidatus Magasanikbacteria bacterium]